MKIWAFNVKVYQNMLTTNQYYVLYINYKLKLYGVVHNINNIEINSIQRKECNLR